jgi:pilus assembly protein CpaB
MRPIVFVLTIIAVIAAGLAAFLAKRWLEQSAIRPTSDAAALTEVLVAARDIAGGSVLQSGDLRFESWPSAAVNARLVVRAAGQDPLPTIVGTVARYGVAEGEPITQAALFRPDGSGLLAGMLGSNMRAVSISISNPSAVSGFILPGDRVDVVLGADVSRDQSQGQGRGPVARFASETVLENVRILAIDQQIGHGRDGAAMQGKTATLEVSPKQAEIVTTAGLMGQLSLSLRSMTKDDRPPSPHPAFTADTEVSKALQAVRGPSPAGKTAHGDAGIRINRGGDITFHRGG